MVGKRGHHGRRDPVQRRVDGATVATELEATLHHPVSSWGGPVFSFVAPLVWGTPTAYQVMTDEEDGVRMIDEAHSGKCVGHPLTELELYWVL